MSVVRVQLRVADIQHRRHKHVWQQMSRRSIIVWNVVSPEVCCPVLFAISGVVMMKTPRVSVLLVLIAVRVLRPYCTGRCKRRIVHKKKY